MYYIDSIVMFYFRLVLILLPRLSITLSRTPFEAIRLYVGLLNFLVVSKRIGKIEKTFTFYFNKKYFTLTLFEGSPDIAALVEIFLYDEYHLENYENIKLIVDAGAHTGNTAIYFHLLCPNATIYAIEASPKTFKQLVKNTQNISQIIPIQAALTDHDGMVTFYETASSLGSSTKIRSHGDSKITINSICLDSLRSKHKVQKFDLVKVDIEGGEEVLFASSSPKDHANQYIIEIHGDLLDQQPEEYEKQFSDFSLSRTQIKQSDRYMLYAKAVN